MTNQLAATFRNLLQNRNYITGVGARDALEAKMIQRAGFDFVWSSGFCISASYGLPDASILSMKTFVEEALAIKEAINIPIIYDGDTGYGNAINVIYLTKILDEAGIAALCLEDKRFPKDTSLLAGGRQELLDAKEFAGKIRAAKDAQKSKDFTVIARTEALIAGMGQQEALDRAMLYTEAGADCIFIHSKSKTPDEIIQFVNAWTSPVPLVLVPTSYPDLTEDKIEELGKVKVIIYANQVLRAAIKASQEVLSEIKRSKGVKKIENTIATLDEVFDLQDIKSMKQNEKKYL
ncbi:phosphoenolpyruvate phosphomutase [Adhaeribacter aerolatus]|uniref:Phosphoenolpyruvate phosphomutase n=1 Tax=Adhaeribacter aerolatus TaxID=670289 RepID=A0A512B679_9BACT|nr:isocitrate lyase/phosphoenolpyruvate mutase family protein [Adhaeribacter aerolatus]GEO07460.1 phosphoenolpyruvate phosphomutase [Adhaeribacter aerolatus]